MEAENKRLRADLASRKQQLVDLKLELEAMRQRDENKGNEDVASLQQKVAYWKESCRVREPLAQEGRHYGSAQDPCSVLRPLVLR
jgi:hypothetical protein